MQNEVESKLPFYNEVVNKKKLQHLISQTFHKYGVVKSSLIIDRVKNLTFHYATCSGISLNPEDLRVPFSKRQLMGLTTAEIASTEQNFICGNITSVERFQKVIDIWNNASNKLKEDVLTYFRESDPLNPLYIMAFSGARGNISQVRQLVGMRGLMADPQGQIIDLPIKTNFREGLKVTEYVISSYGARKGLVDTALRTADSGYLTRRLVDVAQDIIVRDEDCLTTEGLSYHDLFKRYKTTLSFKDRIIGRLLLEPVFSKDKDKLIAPINTEITLHLIPKLENADLESIKVRSPLTCNSNRSVCRKCYGWHLAYYRLVDLGEAVGIVAAQSIGEPGTQLTMRTFHTGGVFSGDLTEQIRAPFSGTVFYQLKSKTTLMRTMHGEKGFKLNESVTIVIENFIGTRINLEIPQGNILLINNGQKVYFSQILAEIKKDANLILEEDTRNVYSKFSGETFFQNLEINNIINKQGSINTINKKAGLIWVLDGETYPLPKGSIIEYSVGAKFLKDSIIARQQTLNNYSGIVKFESLPDGKLLKVLNFSLTLNNTKLFKNDTKNFKLLISNNHIEKLFELQLKAKDILKDGQTIAVLQDDLYKTPTGGIICYNIDENKGSKKKSIKKLFSGTIYWIPEETYVINSSLINNLKVKTNKLIKKGAEIWAGNFTKLGGLVQFDEFTQELVIKPGELFLIKNLEEKNRLEELTFIKPGELIIDNIIAQKLCYIEFIEIDNLSYILIRPVEVYKIPKEKGFVLEQTFFRTNLHQTLKIKTVKRIFFKNWERLKSSSFVNLIKTFLVLDCKISVNLQPQFEPILIQGTKNNYRFKISLYEIFKSDYFNSNKSINNIIFSTNYLVHDNQFVYPKTIISETLLSSNLSGTLVNVKNNETTGVKELLILKENDIKEIKWKPLDETLKVKKGDLIRVGAFITSLQKSIYSGQIYNITATAIFIRVGRAYLISENSIIRVNSSNFVQCGEILATLVYEKLKTVDIVQGLPRVEEILEARKIKNSCLLSPVEGNLYISNSGVEIINENGKAIPIALNTKQKIKIFNGNFVNVGFPLTDGQINPHDMLEVLFQYYRKQFTVDHACKLSFKYLQLFLVNEVQRTYLAQGVQIADKHIEVIVKQMTCKVKVQESGDTTLLPGEILSLYQAEILTQTAASTNEKTPIYIPILLGLTKASLNSDSFISAASFQETARVLTEAAIAGKKDWLNGLKENVIIGRLIPAGAGFNCYEQLRKLKNFTNDTELIKNLNFKLIKESILNFRLNEI
jgi:DNA-directed RNA polymerase subunit beta'